MRTALEIEVVGSPYTSPDAILHGAEKYSLTCRAGLASAAARYFLTGLQAFAKDPGLPASARPHCKLCSKACSEVLTYWKDEPVEEGCREQKIGNTQEDEYIVCFQG
jgi:hypothetical protein